MDARPARLSLEGAHGNTLSLFDWGGDGPGLLLLHGMGAHSGWWDPVVPLLAEGRRVLALDMRGHGDSAWLEPPRYSVEDYAADIEAVRRALGWERFSLAAHSLGARVALHYAAAHPARLTCAAFLDFLAAARPGADARYQRRAKTRQPSYAALEDIAARFKLQPPGTSLDAEALRALGRRSARRTPEGRWTWKFDWRAFYFEYLPVFEEARRVAVPALLARGEHSLTMPREAFHAVLACLPDGRGVELPGAHHHVTLDRPAETAEALASFLESVEAGPSRTRPRSRPSC